MTKHELLRKYLEGLIKGYSNSLIICSPAGLGKSEMTINALRQDNLRQDEHYIYFSSFATPRALVNLLEATNKLSEPKILVIDESEEILKNVETIGILKSALWEVNGKRKVYWITARKHIEFEFFGKIIFILNQINKKSPLINALIDRSLFCNFDLKKDEIISLIKERAKIDFQDIPFSQKEKIIEILKMKDTLSLRDLPKAVNLYRLSPNHYKTLILQN